MKFLSLRRLAFCVAAVLSLTALGGCAVPSLKTQSEQEAEAAAHEKTAAESGNVMAEYLYASHLAGQNDLAGAFVYFLKAAQAGNALAQAKVAGYYYYGSGGVTKDYAAAASWMRKSAEQGNDRAQFSLSTMYKEGVGVPKDKAKQIEWLEKAAWQYNRDALNALTRVGDPHGVVQKVEANRDALLRASNAKVQAERLQQAVQQQNLKPMQQQMCSVNYGGTVGLVPCP
ncbi:tetratricopeptide repeat protein [Burkholderia cepacia]|uniref:tetratricopeptide repeat protein n=1 Tax=Burkholderia cepacia TaxID=292 RepID=UPI001588729D|nr:tetratricopeptide repeat protein [Burkholderia cepacia]